MENTSTSPTLPMRLQLEAINHQRNIARQYSIEADSDLFGHWVVSLRWGRIGTIGQHRIISFKTKAAAACFIAGILRKRASAPKRIGATYRTAVH